MANKDTTDNSSTDLNNDPELDELLDGALADFDTPIQPHNVAVPNPANAPLPTADTQANLDQLLSGIGNMGLFSQNGEQLDEMNKMFRNLIGPEFSQEFEQFSKEIEQKLPEILNYTDIPGSNTQTTTDNKSEEGNDSQHVPSKHKPDSTPTQNSHTTIEQTLNAMRNNIQESFSTTSDNLNPEQPFNIPQDSAEDFNIMGIMQNLMGDMLTKEVLYEPLRELSDQYPKWLENNKSSIGDNEYQRYTSQHELMLEACTLFESETSSETKQAKMNRSSKIMCLLQKLQSLGKPPNELIDDDDANTDNAMPNLSALNLPNCNPQ